MIKGGLDVGARLRLSDSLERSQVLVKKAVKHTYIGFLAILRLSATISTIIHLPLGALKKCHGLGYQYLFGVGNG